MAYQVKKITPAIVGIGALDQLGAQAKLAGVTKMMMIVDPFLVGKAEEIAEKLSADGIESVIFSNVVPDPTDVSVMEAYDMMIAAGGVNGIFGMGGGSAMDTAKALNVLVNNEGTLWDYTTITSMGVPAKPGHPLFLATSNAGTGSEVTTAAVISIVDKGMKATIIKYGVTEALMAFVDPALCLTLPTSQTVSTAIDALCHAAECTVGKMPNPVSDAMAYEACRLIYKYLPMVLETPDSIELREKLSIAAMLAGQAFDTTFLNVCHAYGHGMGATLHKPHGSMVGIALPYAMRCAAPVLPARVQAIGEILGATFTGEETPEEIGAKTSDAIHAFYKAVGFPGLKELGVAREDVLKSVPNILADTCWLFSVHEKESEEKVAEVLGKMYDGEL